MIEVLALCGSLRAASLNAALLRLVSARAPADIRVSVHESLGTLPLFNPDLEQQALPLAVSRFHHAVRRCDVLLVASPEYAHGVSGTIKNALDWLVSFEPFVYKPVVVLNASPRAHHADEAIKETLRTMSACLIEPACLVFPLVGSSLDEGQMQDCEVIDGLLKSMFEAIRQDVARRRSQPPA